MKRLEILLEIMILAFVTIGAANAQIEVSGTGKITMPADMVTIIVTAENNSENLTIAEFNAKEILNKTIVVLANAGVDKKSMISSQGSGVSSFESSSKVCRPAKNNTTLCEYESQSAKKVSKSMLISLKTTDISRINDVISIAKSFGANAEITGYSLSDPSSAIAAARKAAFADAKKKAEDDAALHGVRLGKLEYSIDEPPYIISSDQPGMVDVISEVHDAYEIA